MKSKMFATMDNRPVSYQTMEANLAKKNIKNLE